MHAKKKKLENQTDFSWPYHFKEKKYLLFRSISIFHFYFHKIMNTNKWCILKSLLVSSTYIKTNKQTYVLKILWNKNHAKKKKMYSRFKIQLFHKKVFRSKRKKMSRFVILEFLWFKAQLEHLKIWYDIDFFCQNLTIRITEKRNYQTQVMNILRKIVSNLQFYRSGFNPSISCYLNTTLDVVKMWYELT